MSGKIFSLIVFVLVLVSGSIVLSWFGYDVTPYLSELPSAAVLAIGLGVAGYVVRRAEIRWEKERAVEWVDHEVLYYEGAKVAHVYDTNGAHIEVADDSTIHKYGLGRIVLRLKTGVKWPMSIQEFKAMHVMVYNERNERQDK